MIVIVIVIANDEWPQFTQLQSTGLLGLRGRMLKSYHKLQQKPKTVPEFKKMHFS